MNAKVTTFIKNFSYALTSNLVSLLISTLVVLIVPKVLGVEDYGYWQLYLFYTSYIGFMHFGWNDGIYLRYGGKEYNELNKSLFSTQFYMLVISQVLIAIIVSIVSYLIIEDENKIFIIEMTALCMIIMNVRNLFLFILQATNRIKEFAQITLLGRILYFLLIIALLIFGIKEYKLMIAADLIGKLVSLIFAIICCKDLVFCKMSSLYSSLKETFENINVGIKLMFANIASMLIIGVVRFGIERSWDVSTFGKVSLTLSISNLMMVFINAMGIIMFPILRRTDKKRLSGIYITMRELLMVILLGILIIYYPLRVTLSAWLPNYADSLMYMGLVLPIFLYEGKMALLINTYLKTLRKEKLMLRINLVSLGLSVLLTFLTTVVYVNLNLAMVSIVVLLAFRSILAEFILSKILLIPLYKDTILEQLMVLIFIITGWFINSWMTVLLYGVTYLMYIFFRRMEISDSITKIRLLKNSTTGY